MIAVIAIIAVVVLALVIRAARSSLGYSRSDSRFVDRYGQALRTLQTLPERASADQHHDAGPAGAVRPDPRLAGAVRSGTARYGTSLSPSPPPSPPPAGGDGSGGLDLLDEDAAPWPVREAARVIGLHERAGQREPVVEANARLTGTTGLLLIVLLFLEGLTLPFIRLLVSWHILIGLVLVPPLVVKMASVSWRFARYYLRDPRYRRAGPPHPLLRVLGPLLLGSTVLLFASGIALWLTGPSDQAMFRLHQVSFVLWFVVLAVHVAGHLLRATRLAAADARQASRRAGVPSRLRRQARRRRLLVVASLGLGLVVGIAGRGVSSAWTNGSLTVPARSAGHSTIGHGTAAPPGARAAAPQRSR